MWTRDNALRLPGGKSVSFGSLILVGVGAPGGLGAWFSERPGT